MQKDAHFETAFSDFIDKQEYDAAEQALFAVVREAFSAGWAAANAPVSSPAGEAGGSKGAT